MKRLGILGMVAVVTLICGDGTGSATAKDSPEQVQKASDIVVQTLQRETREGLQDRRELLQAALEAAPDHPLARWQSGFVYDAQHREWRKFDDTIASGAKDDTLVRYREMRAKSPDTVPGQLELAGWCADRKLEDQARAHLSRVLDLNTDHVQARRLLGFLFINGSWVSQRDIAEVQIRARKSAIETAKWIPRLEKLRNDLGRGGRQPERAKQELAKLRDPGAVGAIDVVFCARGGPAALLGIELLQNIRCPEAAGALAWHAVFSPSGHVQEAAVRALQHQDKHDYVPLMLATMRSPVQSRWQIYDSGEQLFYRHMFYAEASDHRDLAVVDAAYGHTVVSNPNLPAVRQRELAADPELAQRYRAAQRQDAQTHAAAMEELRLIASLTALEREMTVARHNREVRDWNGQLCWALSEATGDFRAATPEDWCRWWYDYNEYEPPSDLPLRVHYQDKSQHWTSLGGTPPTNPSCLAAGTPVWTESGPVPVENVRVGDRVFACDTETGQLDLKPVLKTTIRAKIPLLKISAGSDTIEATGGHVFWASGKGWVKTRDLQPERRLHTILGTVDVASVEPAEPQETFNLVVADFHTYFVGQEKILTHDNTMRRPTTCVVPGLTRQTADTADFFRN